jgi:predicted O-methyltransferase YrrM
MVSSRWVHTDAPNLWTVLDEATAVAERHLKVDPQKWWATMGHTAEVPLQVTSLRGMLDRHAALRNGTICEIGFNAGHSAIVWLEKTQTNLVEFDLLSLDYSEPSRRFVSERYPGRIVFHKGPSRETLPLHAERVRSGAAKPCDLWLIDGDHGRNVEVDLFNALAASHAGTIIIADDCGLLFPYVRRFWRVHVGLGSILENGCISTRVKRSSVEKTWCHGEVAKWAAAMGEAEAATLHSRVQQANGGTREARNQAYFNARHRWRARRLNISETAFRSRASPNRHLVRRDASAWQARQTARGLWI